MRRLAGTVIGIFLLVSSMMPAAAARAPIQDDSAEPDLLTIDQAVKLALANNRDLKIVSLDLDISKDKVLPPRPGAIRLQHLYLCVATALAHQL